MRKQLSKKASMLATDLKNMSQNFPGHFRKVLETQSILMLRVLLREVENLLRSSFRKPQIQRMSKAMN